MAPTSIQTAASLDPSRAIRVGIVGCGRMTRNKHLRALTHLSGIECVALADLDSRACHSTADQYGIHGRYADLAALLGHPGLDAVALVLPTKAKAAVTTEALRSGLPLLLEKPLANTVDEAAMLLEEASASATPSLMGFHIAFHGLVRQARQIVEDGGVGRVDSIRTLWCSPWLNKLENKGASHEEMRRRQSEGALIDLGTQCFDLWRRFGGADIDRLWADCIDGARQEEVAVAGARLTNGVLASGVFSTRSTHEIEIEIVGDGGRLRVSAERFDGLEWLPINSNPGSMRQRWRQLRTLPGAFWQGVLASRHGGGYLGSIHRQWAHFERVVRGQESPMCTLHDGFQALAATQAARESARTGEAVTPVAPPSRAVAAP